MSDAFLAGGTLILAVVAYRLTSERVAALFAALERHRELDRVAQRQRIVTARIQHIYRAAEQAMWQESLDTWAKAHGR